MFGHVLVFHSGGRQEWSSLSIGVLVSWVFLGTSSLRLSTIVQRSISDPKCY